MKNEKSISLGDFKSIFLSDSFDQKNVVVALYTESAYTHIKLSQDQLSKLIEALKSFQKVEA